MGEYLAMALFALCFLSFCALFALPLVAHEEMCETYRKEEE
jgi:hypothetical protein